MASNVLLERPQCPEWFASKASEFVERGFLTVDNIFSASDMDLLHMEATANFTTIRRLINIRNLCLGIGIKQGFKEIVQRHLNRFEMTFEMNSGAFHSITEDTVIVGLVASILGSEFKVLNISLVLSLPGATNQSWHSDGPHLSVTTDLPCHCLNIFIPLIDVDMVNGPTSFRPESHLYTRDLSRLYMKAFAKKTLRAIESPCLCRGSILLFDYRYTLLSLFST